MTPSLRRYSQTFLLFCLFTCTMQNSDLINFFKKISKESSMINDENTTTLHQLISRETHKKAAKQDRNDILQRIRQEQALIQEAELFEMFNQMCSIQDQDYLDYIIAKDQDEEQDYFSRQYERYEAELMELQMDQKLNQNQPQ